MYLGQKKIKSVTDEKDMVLVEFEKIGDDQPKPYRTSQELLEWCQTKKLEPDASTKFKERRMNFFIKVIFEELSRDGSFFSNLAEFVLTRDEDSLHKKKIEFIQRISDQFLKHNIPLSDYAGVLDQTSALVRQRTVSILDWIAETFAENITEAHKNLFKEGKYDLRTFEDVHKLNK